MAERLPIYEIENELLQELSRTRRVVLQAPTGSGKSTQVPQILLQHGLLDAGQAVILQPRRIAARMLAARVASEMGVELGREVGYQIRFENVSSSATRIQFETEGVLLRKLVQDPTLRGIQVLIFDEFHERHLYGDVTLARALEIQEQSRPDLLIIVMSATLDSGALEKYMQPCAAVKSQGRVFPVDVEYWPRAAGSTPVWDLAAQAFSKYSRLAEAGDVLIFMPGGYEIHRTIEAIRNTAESKAYVVLPLHGELSANDQDAAVARHDRPKVVVATNVAETSITIDGVKLVIDSGLARIPRYDPNRGINTLLVERISQASAEQRAGRAGRTRAGACVRLWTRSEHDARPLRELPEIKRVDLSEAVLMLKAAGVEDLRAFRWLEPPNEAALAHAEELLVDLGALNPLPGGYCAITDLGRRMLAFPVHPRYARMLIAAQEQGCVFHACLLAALTQGRDLLLRKPDKVTNSMREDVFNQNGSSDFWILIQAWTYATENQFSSDALRQVGVHGATVRQVGPLHQQFLRIAQAEGLDINRREVSEDALRKCILIGFSDRVGRRTDEGTLRCQLVHGRRGVLTKESAVRESPLFVAAEINEIGGRPGEVVTILSLVTAIETDWLRELFPSDVRSQVAVVFDATTRRVIAADILRFRDLEIESKPVEPPPSEAARLLAEEILAGRLQLPKWDHAVTQWILRLNSLGEWCPDLQLPAIYDEDQRAILESLCLGAASYKEIKDRDVLRAVTSWVSHHQRGLIDKHAPERVTLANGRTPKVIYDASGPPYISLRIQELYGVNETPRIAMGRVPLTVHILAPSMRPVQVTQDLGSFWREHYPRVKSELKRKYPKHEWR